MNLDLSGIALIISVASPIVTTIVNIWYQNKTRREDYLLHHRANVIEGYLQATGAVIHNYTTENVLLYGQHLGEIYMYISKDHWPTIQKIDSLIGDYNHRNRTQLLTEFAELCTTLAKDPPRKSKR